MSLLDDVKQRLDIVQVVSETIALDTRARTPKALCPFHAEKTPSFYVYPDQQRWHCFGACATGGDALSFIMKRDNLPFAEALKQAASRFGIAYQPRDGAGRGGPSLPTGSGVRTPLVRANETALSYFRAVLDSPHGAEARAYLAGRGISMDVAARRELGLSPKGLETLAGHLKAQGISGGAAKGAGLVSQTRDGGWRDMLAGRLTIAIRDGDGTLVGFAGRSLDGFEPKYLNTPRTELFDKSRILYGLHWAAPGIRKSGVAVVVEGYTDTITAHEAGFDNVVASMGTAVTSEQIGLLAGMAKTVILALDADAAGQESTVSKLEDAYATLLKRPRHGTVWTADHRVVTLFGGKDADEVIRTSPDDWRHAVATAAPLAEWLLIAYAEREDTTTPEGRAAVASRMMPIIALTPDLDQQAKLLDQLGQRIGSTEERLRASLQEARRNVSRRRPPTRTPELPPVVAADVRESPETVVEEYLLSLILSFPDLREYVSDLPDDVFADAGTRALFTAWKGLETSDTMDLLQDSTDPDLAQRLEHLLNRPLPPSDQSVRVADALECVRRLHERHLRRLKAQEARVRTEVDGGAVPEETRALIDQQALETNERLRQLFARHP